MSLIKTHLAIIFLCLATMVAAQKRSYYGAFGDMYGNVASITLIDSMADESVEISCGAADPVDLGHTTHVLDEKGNQLSCKYYDNSGVLAMQVINRYDASNNRIESLCRDKDGRLDWRQVFQYDKEGWLTGSLLYDSTAKAPDTLRSKMQYREVTKYYYDRNGEATTMVNFAGCTIDLSNRSGTPRVPNRSTDTTIKIDGKGWKHVKVAHKIWGWETYLYDGDNREIEKVQYGTGGDTQYVDISEYDKQGRLVMHTSTSGRDPYSAPLQGSKEEYEYDEYGHKTRHRIYELTGDYKEDSSQGYKWENWYVLTHDERFKTDSEGRQLEHVQYARETLLSRITNKYDQQGNLIQSIQYDRNNSIKAEVNYRYANLDSHGNWQKMISWTWHGAGPSTDMPLVGYRQIEYYD